MIFLIREWVYAVHYHLLRYSINSREKLYKMIVQSMVIMESRNEVQAELPESNLIFSYSTCIHFLSFILIKFVEVI